MNKSIFISYCRLLIFLGLAGAGISGDAEEARTFCNPLNIDYRFSISIASYREAADPVVVTYGGEYYLFASHSSGYWWSRDFETWNFVEPTGLAIEKFAPAIMIIGKTMYYTSSEAGDLFQTDDPKQGKWTRIGNPHKWDDPALFRDDDGRVFCYFNASPLGTIDGIELDPARQFAAAGTVFNCFKTKPQERGFEVSGDNNDSEGRSYFEGAWMNKINGTYYLQYAAPGTTMAYCDACYTSKSPTGPFTFMPSSPVTAKIGGFISGAGHGCLFQDLKGNWWKIDTAMVSVAHQFERRLVVFPAGIDKDGLLHANTELGDWPQFLPGTVKDPLTSNSPKWNLLSFGKPVAVSSLDRGRPAAAAVDENIKTWWAAASDKPGEFLSVDLGQPCQVNAVQINFAENKTTYKGGRKEKFAHRYRLEGSPDGKTWSMLADKSENTADVPHDYIQLKTPAAIRHVRVTNFGPMPGGGTFAIRDLRVFGSSNLPPPAAPDQIKFERQRKNEFVSVDLGQPCKASAVQLDFGTAKPPKDGGWRTPTIAQRYQLEGSMDGTAWSVLPTRGKPKNTPPIPLGCLLLENPASIRYLRVTNNPTFARKDHLPIATLRVVATDGSPLPATVPGPGKPERREEADLRSVTVSWNASPNADGYIIRYGIAPTKLYNNYQVIKGTSQAVNSLVVGPDYWFTVDAYNGGGVARGTTTVMLKAQP
jgi:hypothetical protein